MLRSVAAKVLSLILTDPGGDPYAAFFVHGKAMGVRLTRPDRFVAPIRRRVCGFGVPFARRLWVANGQLDLTGRVAHWVDDGKVVRCGLESAIDRTICVDGGITFVA